MLNTQYKWEIEKTYEDLRLHIRLRPYDATESECHLAMFEVFHLEENGYGLKFNKKDSNYSSNSVDIADEAETLITGSIKWDGCSDINFGRNGYIHGCCREDVVRMGTILNILFDEAKNIITSNIDYE